MARPLRIEFPDAVYHVTARGDRREVIYRGDADRVLQLALIGQAMERFDAQVLAYCLMGNHFHLVVQTRQANLSRLMRHINGSYTQAFNRRHGMAGHLFQGRYKAVLVDQDSYLQALCRYVERNPVAAGLVAAAGDWPWSSYRARSGQAAAPEWLDVDRVLSQLLGRPLDHPGQRQRAMQLYATWVGQARLDDASFWADGLRGQVFLGDAQFVERMHAHALPERLETVSIPKQQRQRAATWAQALQQCGNRRDEALLLAHKGGMTMTALAAAAGLSVSHVSRLIARVEAASRKLPQQAK